MIRSFNDIFLKKPEAAEVLKEFAKGHRKKEE